ncbi:MAG: IS200/IS605 family transposase [Verrucomicrobiota bacterium]
MPQSLAPVYLHIVFSTKDRKPFLESKETRQRVFDYLGGICHNHDCPPMEIGGVEDHTHILCRFGRTISIADLLMNLKRDSTKWIKAEFQELNQFSWQAGYGAFSVSPGHLDALRAYIRNQEEHHATVSFQDELRRLCAKYGATIDERYAWD